MGKTESGGGVRSSIYRLQLCYNATFSYVVVMSFYIKNDETKNLSGLQFKT